MLSRHDPLKVVGLIKGLAELKRRHPKAGTSRVDFTRRLDLDLYRSGRCLCAVVRRQFDEPKTARLVEDLATLSTFYADCFNAEPTFKELWRLGQPPRLASMQTRNSNLSAYRCKTAWVNKYGAERGEALNREAEQHFENVDRIYRELLGQVADGLVGALSTVLDGVIAAFARRKQEAAVLDFDDLLVMAHGLSAGMNPSERRSADDSGTSSSMNSRTPIASRPQSFFPSPPRKRLSAGRMRGFDLARSFWWAIRSRPSIASAGLISQPTTRRARVSLRRTAAPWLRSPRTSVRRQRSSITSTNASNRCSGRKDNPAMCA